VTEPVQQQIEALQAAAAQPGADLVDLALRIEALAGQLSGADAVAGQQAAVDILATLDPLVSTDSLHCMRLAEQQHTLAVRMIAAGQSDQAEAVGRQAVATYRQAAALSSPAIEEIANNLTILDKQLTSIPDMADALLAQQAAVDVLGTPADPDPDGARQEMLADALFNLAARLIDNQRVADAGVAATEAIDHYTGVLTILRTELQAGAATLGSLARTLLAAGLPDAAAQVQQAAVAAGRGDPAAVLPAITAGTGPADPMTQAAAAVQRVQALFTLIATTDKNLHELAPLLDGAGLGAQAQAAVHAQGIPPGLLDTPAQSYCAIAGAALPPPRPDLSFPPLQGQWPQGNLTVQIRTNMPLPGIDPGVARQAQLNAVTTWQQASRDVTRNDRTGPDGFFSFAISFLPRLAGDPPVDETPDITVYFADETVISAFGAGSAAAVTAGFPENNPAPLIPGVVILNGRFPWPSAAELEAATLHAFGHLLGFTDSHTTFSSVPGSVPGTSQTAVATMHPASLNTALDTETLSVLRAVYGWRPQQQAADRGTDQRPSLGVRTRPDGTQTVTMVWKGIGEATMYHSDFKPAAMDWTPQQPLPADLGLTIYRPVLAQLAPPDGGLMLVWGEPDPTGTAADVQLRFAIDTGGGWQTPVVALADAASSAGPAVTTFNATVWMAWKGNARDGGLWWSMFDPAQGRWLPQQSVTAGPDGTAVTTTDSPALVGLGGRLHLFWRVPDGNIFTSSHGAGTDNDWTPQQRVELHRLPGGGDPGRQQPRAVGDASARPGYRGPDRGQHRGHPAELEGRAGRHGHLDERVRRRDQRPDQRAGPRDLLQPGCAGGPGQDVHGVEGRGAGPHDLVVGASGHLSKRVARRSRRHRRHSQGPLQVKLEPLADLGLGAVSRVFRESRRRAAAGGIRLHVIKPAGWT